MAAPSPVKLVPSTDGVIDANAGFTLFNNQLFAPQASCYQQLSMAANAPPLLAAEAQQPSYGMGDDITKELQRALEHRHSMLKTYKHLTEDLWVQLQQVLDTSELLLAQHATVHQVCSAAARQFATWTIPHSRTYSTSQSGRTVSIKHAGHAVA
jgi:hypothetical protein